MALTGAELGALGGGGGSLIGGIAVLAGAGGKGGIRDAGKAKEIWAKLKTSDFDFRSLDPPELLFLQQMDPELYTAIVPEEFREVEESPFREDQARSLDILRRYAEEGETELDRIQRLESVDAITAAQGRGTEDALRQAAQRGALSSGDELRYRLGAGGQATQLAAELGRSAVADAALRRLGAAGQYGAAAGQARGQDFQRSSANANIANRFSEIYSQMKTDEARENTAARERAQSYNLGRQAEVSDTNILNRYNVGLENLDRQNQLRDQLYQQNLYKTQGLAGAYLDRGAYKEQQKEAKERAILGVGKGGGTAAGYGYAEAR